MTTSPSSFIDILAFSSPPIQAIDHAELLQDLDLWTNAQFTFDMATKVPGQHQATIPLQFQPETIDDTALKYLSSEQHTSAIQPRAILPKVDAVDDMTRSVSTTLAVPNAVTKLRKRTGSFDDDISSAEEDKRRRNTAASARFRARKKLREHAMETAIKEMTLKSSKLEERVEELEPEIIPKPPYMTIPAN
ncbi:hypothetical protein BX666DRAFT_1880577 [Dichotomocladium elegans]|nr:hypothetical protein BX666DRAFT_1880577 [Dichotomocladium elegans]